MGQEKIRPSVRAISDEATRIRKPSRSWALWDAAAQGVPAALAPFWLKPASRQTEHEMARYIALVIPVIYLDWSDVDLRSNPLHPPKRRFDSRSATELQCKYILLIVSLGTTFVLYWGVEAFKFTKKYRQICSLVSLLPSFIISSSLIITILLPGVGSS